MFVASGVGQLRLPENDGVCPPVNPHETSVVKVVLPTVMRASVSVVPPPPCRMSIFLTSIGLSFFLSFPIKAFKFKL